MGTTWVWRAVAPEYRLRLGSVVGNRTLYSARQLFRRIRRALNGQVPLFTSDQLPHYTEILLETFGSWERPPRTGRPGRPKAPSRVPHPELGYAQVVKHRRQGRVVAVTRRVIFGQPTHVAARAATLRRANGRQGQINTAYIERDNLTLRQELSRLARKTLGFSKKRRELQQSLDFADAYANFVRPHRALRLPAPESPGGSRRWVPRSPAMAAGITDHIWTLKELMSYRC